MTEKQRKVHYRLKQVRRLLLDLNLFETDDTDENTIQVQRWSTRVYLCTLILGIGILFIQHGLHVEPWLIEIKNPSLELYLQLRNYHMDMNCLCSQISNTFGSFLVLKPLYHPICSSEFISQIWIETLVDKMTSFRYPGDFRAVASTQFQTLRELCHFAQSNMQTNIESFYGRELTSRVLLNEDQWRIENKAFIDAFVQSSFTNVKHKISVIRSFIIYNLLISGIQTSSALGINIANKLWIVDIERIFYQPYPDASVCACDDGGGCYFPSSFYNADKVNNFGYIMHSILESKLSLRLQHWFTGCWALESLYVSSLNNSFLYRQFELDLMRAYFNWSSNAKMPSALYLTNQSNGRLDDLVETSFVDNMTIELNYSAYFQQCQPESCFYSAQKYGNLLYIFTSLLSLSGGLSVILRFIIPRVVAYVIKRIRRRSNRSIEQVQRITCRERILGMLERIRRSVVELNLFRSSTKRQPFDVKQQRWTTRIYIFFLIIGTIIFTFYASLTVQKQSIEIRNPTFEQILHLQMQTELNYSLECPCTQISISLSELVHLQPFYHQVCSSDFIKESWLYHIRALLQVNRDLTLHRLDFRHSYQLFYLLRQLCGLINETVHSSLEEFQHTQFVTGYLLSTDVFEHQMKTSIQKFQTDLISIFLRFFQLTRNISYVNQYFSNANAGPLYVPNYYTTYLLIHSYVGINETSWYVCSCANDINCKSQLGLYDREHTENPKSLVPGMYRACFALESLLQSTIECFYDDQDCLTAITDFYQQEWFPTDFIRLDSTMKSRFTTKSTIGSLLAELFIEYWNESLNYTSYFSECQPISCSYEILRRNNLLDTVTTVLGLVGGLSASLQILIPFIASICVGLIQRRQHQSSNTKQTSTLMKLIQVMRQIKNWFQQLNVFDNPKKTTGNYLQKQRQGTYIYLILLCIALTILLMYNSLAYFPNRITVSNPSLDRYEQLQQQYSTDDIDCPCSQISITYASFIDFNCRFHPVCTSDFISNIYLQELFRIYNNLDVVNAKYNAFTLAGTAFAHFQTLRTLCDLVTDTFKDLRRQYLSSSVIFASMINRNRFNQQINSSLNRFNSTLPDEFLSNLQLIRGMMQSNAFVSLYSTNWYLVSDGLWMGANVYMQPQYYNNCNCLISAFCTQPSKPYIPGYLVGCTPFEALLQSSIECLYDSICIENFHTYLRLQISSLSSINISKTRFVPQTTVGTMMKEMLIETCSSNISYKQFFDQCRPHSCSISIIQRNGLITVITILFGLYGGLRLGLKIIVLIFISIIYKVIRKRQAAHKIHARLDQK